MSLWNIYTVVQPNALVQGFEINHMEKAVGVKHISRIREAKDFLQIGLANKARIL